MRQDEDLPVISAMTASVAPSESEPESPMNTCAGWTLNHRKPSSAPMIRAHRKAMFGWRRDVEQRDDQERDEREDERPAREAVETVRDVDAVAGGHDRERGEEDVDDRVDGDVADERDADAGDLVRALDLEGGDQGHHGLPEQLLAGADPLARPGVEVVVRGAQQAHQREGRQRGDDAALDRPAEQEVDGEDHEDDQEAAHRRASPTSPCGSAAPPRGSACANPKYRSSRMYGGIRITTSANASSMPWISSSVIARHPRPARPPAPRSAPRDRPPTGAHRARRARSRGTP